MESDQGHIKKGIELLKDILASKVNVEWFTTTPKNHDRFMDVVDVDLFYRSVLWMLEDPSSVHERILRAHGIQEEGAGIFFACGPIYRLLLEGTVWRRSDIAPTLESLPGAIHTSRRIGWRNLRGIFFPNKGEVLALSRRRG